jgi:two-component system, OmpR family, sensor histidine kinase KdpD
VGTRLRPGLTALVSIALVALVTGVIFGLREVAPVLSLGVLYLFAVLPVAALWGLWFAVPVSIVSMLAFNFFFLEPRHTLRLSNSENWVALAVYLATAISVSALAARARRRAAEAEQREREAALAAEISALLLESEEVQPQLGPIAVRIAALIGVERASIELGSLRAADPGLRCHDLQAGGRHVGRLHLDARAPEDVAERVAAMLGSLLATALERERLAREAQASEEARRSEAIETEALRRSDTLKTAILRSVSHDLRSPITAIMTAAEVLRSDTASPQEKDELLASMRMQAHRLEHSVANLLNLSRLEAGAARPAPELWAIDSLIAQALEDLGPDHQRVDVKLPAETPPVLVDPTQVEHALFNLLENALRFSPPAERVAVEVGTLNGDVLVRVADSGPGIPPAEQRRIFEPFVRGKEDAGERGSGLGLSIVRGFVQVNGGRVWVESEPGRGSTFVISIPAAQPVPS